MAPPYVSRATSGARMGAGISSGAQGQPGPARASGPVRPRRPRNPHAGSLEPIRSEGEVAGGAPRAPSGPHHVIYRAPGRASEETHPCG